MKFKSFIISAAVTAGSLLALPAPSSATEIIRKPTHFTVEYQPGPCTLTVGNGQSVHPNTTVVAHDLATWETLGELHDVENAAYAVTSTDIVIPEGDGKIDIYVIPGDSISSLDISTVSCIPVPESDTAAPEQLHEIPAAVDRVEPLTDEEGDADLEHANPIPFTKEETPPATSSPKTETVELATPAETVELPEELAGTTVKQELTKPAETVEVKTVPVTTPATTTPPADSFSGNPDHSDIPTPTLDMTPRSTAGTAELAHTGSKLSIAVGGFLTVVAGIAATVFARKRGES